MPFYRFSAAATGPDDGLTTLKPNDLADNQPGRWLLIRDNIAVTDLITLRQIAPANRSDGLPQYVQSEAAWFTFRSGATAGGDNAVPIVGTGAWVKEEPALIATPYRQQTRWEDGVRSGATIKSNIQLPAIVGAWTIGIKSGAIARSLLDIPGVWVNGVRSGISIFAPFTGIAVWDSGFKSGAVIEAQIITSGGLFDDMTTTHSTTGSRSTTKPTTTPSAPETQGFVIEETFVDLGFFSTAITDSVTSDVVECKIKRTGFWAYVDRQFASPEWDWITGEITVTIDKVDGSALTAAYAGNPINLAILPDVEGQVLHITQYNAAASTTKRAYSRWISYRTPTNTGAAVPNESGVYWGWANDGTSTSGG